MPMIMSTFTSTPTPGLNPTPTSSNTSPKTLLKRAETSFLKRDYQKAIEYIQQTLAQLATPRSLTWAIELGSKERIIERQRARAVSLFVTASALRWNETSPQKTVSDEMIDTPARDTPSDASTFLRTLNDQVLDNYSPSLPTGMTISIPPPSVIETVSLAGLSMDVPLPFIRSLVEPYLDRLDNPTILTTLAQPSLASAPDPALTLAQPSDETWWKAEAVKGYQSLIQLYLLNILAPDGIGGRAEASRLLEWDDRLNLFAKDIIRSKLSAPTPPSPSVHEPQSEERTDDFDFSPLSPWSSAADTKSPLYHPSAMTSLLPSPLASPSPSHASLTSQPTRSDSPGPSRPNRKRPSWLLILSALPPTAILYLVVWYLKKKPSLGSVGRHKLVDLFVRLAAALWRDLIATFRLGTALTYV
ncbi:hypothetical protein [Phaffia rhodozyma]|uniref:Uncharacterized protein n=1 Tax=Phaffia rhodozyma TaxID=264483 RepID=A0A0F7SW66_PHARH|nr:hypothetical protein [Phaffia rhodozyma]